MNLRQQVIGLLPQPLDLAQKSVRTAIHRLGLWRGLLNECRGVTPQDQAVLMKSFRAALPRLASEPGQWREPQLVEDARIAVKGGFTFFIRARTDDLGHIRQTTHRKLLDSVARYLPEGGIAIDAGSNIGIFTANFARAVGPCGRVIAVEMMPDTAASLKRTIAQNNLDNVELVELALADVAGKELKIGMPDASHFGQASIVRNLDSQTRSICVTTTTLDDITAGFDHCHVIKMDLEGAEAAALKGAARTLQITDAILYEVAPDDDRLDKVFEDTGFSVRRIDGLNKLAEKIRR